MSLVEKTPQLKVELCKEGDGYLLKRGGKPFFVKGAGGFQHVECLARMGGNSLRTWGYEQTEKVLPEVRKCDLSLCAGLWLVPPRLGFDYDDPKSTTEQFATLKAQVDSLKDEPSLLIWGVGNELDLGCEATDSVWEAVETIAAYIKSVDASHPVMTVLSRTDERSLKQIDRLCPSIDFVSFNSYGDLQLVQPELDRIGWRRPYLVTEWGANGHWEVPKTDWGAEIEPTSTEKARQIRERYRSLEKFRPQCLGSYVFLWGNKQERTPTWHGLFSPKGRATEAVAVIESLWKGRETQSSCPRIGPILLSRHSASDSLVFQPGVEAEVGFEVFGELPPLGCVRWSLATESYDRKEGGDEETAGWRVDTNFDMVIANAATFRVPDTVGEYRLYLEVLGGEDWIATANFPFRVAE